MLDAWIAMQETHSASYTAADLFEKMDNWNWPVFSKTCRSPLVLGQALRRLAGVSGWVGRITSTVVREGPDRQAKTLWTITKAAPLAGGGP